MSRASLQNTSYKRVDCRPRHDLPGAGLESGMETKMRRTVILLKVEMRRERGKEKRLWSRGESSYG